MCSVCVCMGGGLFFSSPLSLMAPSVFDSVCADYGISFMKDHKKNDCLWDITIGPYTLTSQLASERGYIMTNYSTTLVLDVPLFTIG